MAVRRILITGCSGAGKSTLVDAMAARGHEVMKEPGRRVIRAETRMGGKGLPWVNPDRFCRLCLRMAAADWEGVRAGTVFFDRGVFDAAVNLARLDRQEMAEDHLRRYPYDPVVILVEPWEALFSNDPDRQHSFGDAVAEFDLLTEWLARLGYTPQIAPQVPVQERADWLEGVIRTKA